MKAITRILAAGLLALATGAGTTATPASLGFEGAVSATEASLLR